jgi:hypothetical protein
MYILVQCKPALACKMTFLIACTHEGLLFDERVLQSCIGGFWLILHHHCTTTLTIFVQQYNIFCLTVKQTTGRSIRKRNRNLLSSIGLLTGSRLAFYLIDTPLPFGVRCPAVVPLHFVANGVWIDNFVPFWRHMWILIIVDCYTKVVYGAIITCAGTRHTIGYLVWWCRE